MADELNIGIIRGNEITPREIEWLWYPYIPFGKLTLLQGDPGEGKSTFALNLAAQITRGGKLFNSDDELEPMNVIYQNTEDDLDDTVIPRFIKAGGDIDRIFFIDESNEPLTFDDVDKIGEAIRRCNARLVIFDPLVSYIGSDVSMNQANEVRAKFNQLIRIAKETKCAVLVIGHINKMQGTKALYRSVGSIDVVGAARSCLVIGTYCNEPDSRIMAVQKCNLAEKGASIQYEICDGRVEFLNVIELSADELLGSFSCSAGNKANSKGDRARECLLTFLSDGAKSQQEVMDKMRELGIGRRTAENAKADLGVLSEKCGTHWFWKLPMS